MATDYTPSELMVCRAARELRDGEVVFVGIGLPNLACNLARRLHAPNLVLIYESGAVGAVPERLPVSIGDPSLVTDSLSVCAMADIFYLYLGNLNTTVVGDYAKPKVRLPGSGGACEIAINAKRVVVIAPQTKRGFPERVDFVTSPGFLGGGDERQQLGMPGGGPAIVVTDLACFTFENGEMTLSSLHPGVTLEQVRANLGWEVRIAPQVEVTEPPRAEELRVVREELDPRHFYI
jgi:glutaconate CoA-transferase subunit B